MLGGACPVPEGEQRACSVDKWMATVRSCIRGHHRFYAVALGVDKLLVS